MKKKYTIGVQSYSYNPYRNFAGHDVPGFQFKKIYDFFKLLDHSYYKIFGINKWLFQNSFLDFGLNGVNLLHFFNSLSYNHRTPFIVSFESEMPRYKSFEKIGIDKMASKQCKKMVALSQNALNMLHYTLEKYPAHRQNILDKTIVLHPPQQLLINNYAEKKLDKDKISFTFIGSHFFRKGGGELLVAFEKLILENHNIELHIISKMDKGHWLDEYITAKDAENAQNFIKKYAKNIHYHHSMPNVEVLELLKNTHIGILPTYGESYGYSVLEAQAAGCPTITTDVWALLEVNNNTTGWLLNVPKITQNGAVFADLEGDKKSIFTQILTDEIYKTIKHICQNPHEIKEKGEAALKNIAQNHAPAHHIAALHRIYMQAMQNA